MSDWDASDDESKTAPKAAVASGSGAAAAAAPAPSIPRQNRFAGEDEEDEEDDWDASDDDKSAAPKAPTAAPRKKGTLKQKLAEKAALAAAGGNEDDLIDETTPQERRRREQARKLQEKIAEQEADLAHAADLLGLKDDDTLGLSKANPKTDAEYRTLAGQIHAAYIERLTTKPRYTVFVDEFIKHLLASLTDVEARKVNTAVGVIANVKTTEAKDKSSGKKKGGKAKPVLGAGKAVATKPDTELYDEALDDDLDFM